MRSKSQWKHDWLQYDHEAGSMSIADWDGKTGHYVKALHLQEAGGSDLEVSFAGGVVHFDEVALRSLPEKIIVKRCAETSPVLGTPKIGAKNSRFEFVRRD